MSRWFRHYAGMMRDEKLVRVAVKAKQPVERVVWVWGAILESAAEINDGGRYELDLGEAAYFLRCDESELAGIVGELQNGGRIHDGVVVRWSDRQFDSDGSKERQRRYRERQKAGNGVQQRDDHLGETRRDVTPPSPDGEVTLQETEAETDKEDASASSRRAIETEFDDSFWPAYPVKRGKPEARKAFFAARKRAPLETIMAGVHRYAAERVGQDAKHTKHPQGWLNGDRWNDEPLPLGTSRPATGPPRHNGRLTVMDAYHDIAREQGWTDEPAIIPGNHDDAQRLPAERGSGHEGVVVDLRRRLDGSFGSGGL